MNGEEEKNSQTMALLICNLIIWGLVIGTLICIFLIDKVYASYVTITDDNVVSIRNSSGTVLSTNTSRSYPVETELSYTSTYAHTNTKYRITIPNITWATAKFDYQIDWTITINNDSNSAVNLSLTQTKYYWNDGTEITSGCETTYTRNDSATNPLMDRSLWYISTTCVGISPPANRTGIYIETPLSTISSGGTYYARKLTLNNAKRNAYTDTDPNQSTVNAINNQTNQIINNINSSTDNIVDQLQQNNLELQHGWNSPEQPPTNTSDNAFNKENQILGQLDTSFSIDRPQIDTTSNNLIWEWVHRILFTNVAISGMVITLLTLGVIKLILGR